MVLVDEYHRIPLGSRTSSHLRISSQEVLMNRTGKKNVLAKNPLCHLLECCSALIVYVYTFLHHRRSAETSLMKLAVADYEESCTFDPSEPPRTPSPALQAQAHFSASLHTDPQLVPRLEKKRRKKSFPG